MRVIVVFVETQKPPQELQKKKKKKKDEIFMAQADNCPLMLLEKKSSGAISGLLIFL